MLVSRHGLAVAVGLLAIAILAPACTRSGFNSVVLPGTDARVSDRGLPDASVFDARAFDRGLPDASVFDARASDRGLPDARVSDAVDVGEPDVADAQVPDAAPLNPLLGTFTISPPTLLANVNSAAHEISPTLSADGLTLYFGRRTGHGAAMTVDLFVATRPDFTSSFGGVVPLTGLNTPTYRENKMSVSGDGLVAYVTANWPGGKGDFDLWEIRRKSLSAPFERTLAVNLASVNGKDADWDPFITIRGLCLYYGVDTYAGGPGDNELMVACRPGLSSAFQAGKMLGTINTAEGEGNPSLTEDGLVLVFNRIILSTHGSDIYYATRATKNAPFTVRGALSVVNTKEVETEPFIRRDGREIFFSAIRSGGKGGLDLYHAMVAVSSP